MDQFDLQKYLNIALRRKYWIIIAFLFTLLAGLAYFLVVPKIFEATALILVQPQKVPQSYVRSLILEDIDFTLETIIRQVTTRTNLESIIKQHSLYGEPGKTMSMEEKVNLMRQRIKIIRGTGKGARRGVETHFFSIIFQGENPKQVMGVVNALASHFITENLKLRESQSMGTTAFLGDEILSVAKQLSEKEEEIRKYRETYMGELPQQLQANLNTLARLEAQYEAYKDNLRDAQNRRLVIEEQIEEERKNFFQGLLTGFDAQVKDLPSLKNLLTSLRVRYTENHPDVIRLKELIADLEAEQSKPSTKSSSPSQGSWLFGVSPALKRQLAEIHLQIKSFEADIVEIQSSIKLYQKKVDRTPTREQELSSLERDYENLRDLYNSLLHKKMEAELSLSMEKAQKGEQFQLLDPATLPNKPIKPNVLVIAMVTLFLGLGSGVGLAFFRETMDTSYRTPEEAEKELRVPVLVSIPIRYTKKELVIQKTKAITKAASVAIGFVICAIGIVVATKGMDTTLDFARNLRDKTMIDFTRTGTSSPTEKFKDPLK